MVDYLLTGLAAAFAPTNLLYCFIGVFVGNVVGVLPGIGVLTTIALLLPITFYLEPTTAIVMLAGVYYGSAYGGSTASILLNLPGAPSSAVTCLDGYPMARQGRGGVALLVTTVASFGGASIGILMMMLLSPQIARIALSFGPTEYFSIVLLGLIASSTIAANQPLKGIAMVFFGVMLGIIGTDVNTGTQRLTFGIFELFDGLSLPVVAMGLFGVSEILASVRRTDDGVARAKISFRSMIPTRIDFQRSWPAWLRGSIIGSLLGAIPGVGGAIASFTAYAVERNVSRRPQEFGTGAIEGVVSPEAANNAADQTAFIPTMTLGIPGSAVMALMVGALMIHGIAPGPRMMSEHPELFWGLVMSFWVGNLMLLILNIPLIGIWIRLLTIPYRQLYPAIMMFICVGAFALNNNPTTVIFALGFGLLGYGMRLLDLPAAPLLLGLVLGPMLEENLRRAMVISQGSFATFLERPLSATFLVATVLVLAWVVWRGIREREPAVAANAESDT